MQKPCTCDFLHGELTDKEAINQLAQAVLVPEERKVEITYYRKDGSDFQCNTHIIPVKNEEGVVIMFILNFELVLDEGSDRSTENITPASPTRSDLRRSRFFRFRQAALSLMNTNKQSLPQEDPDAVMVESPKEDEDSVALESFPSPTKSVCSPNEANDMRALIGSSHHSSQASIGPEPLDHSSLKVPWEKLYQTEPHQSSLIGSTSDSNINKYSTIHKIPLIALNFSEVTEKKPHSPPTSEKPIIAPKVKDRTHNVTEKVTQVLSLGADVLPEYKLQTPRIDKCTILHYSPFKAVWDWLILLLVIYTAILTPYSAAFLLNDQEEQRRRKNDIFGEMIHLYAKSGKSNADVRALSYCDLSTIQREDLLEVLDMYPEFSDCFFNNLELTFNLRDDSAKPTDVQESGPDDKSCKGVRRRISFTPDRPKGENKEVITDAHKERGSNSCLKRCSVALGSSSLSVPVLDSDVIVRQNLGKRTSVEDLRCDKWACKKPTDYLVESAHFQDLREDDNSASEVTYGEVEQRLSQLQEHLNRLESQLISDIQTILQMLQRQPTLGPPAYSTVTASPDYQRPAGKVQPVVLTASHFYSHASTQGPSHKLESTIQESKDSVSSSAIGNAPVEDSLTAAAIFTQRHTDKHKQQQQITVHQQSALIPPPAETSSASCSSVPPSEPGSCSARHHKPISDPEFLKP
uniref:Potassium voltage-gated channel, subfamily H (Eag-related), member 7 n=1 Tax=Nothobranchius korthausae TaxID=1143690 RepID=A0A1A8GP47_9TELE